jgi:hypothetical protein
MEGRDDHGMRERGATQTVAPAEHHLERG